MADAAMVIINTDDMSLSGQTLVDESLLRAQGVTDFTHYNYDSSAEDLMRDLYLDE